MQDNKKYLENLSKKKKEITVEIRKIDTLLNDEKLLREEYEKRNSKLPNKEKIFSVSHLKIMLEKERKNKLEEIKKCNKQMEPQQFIETKKELEERNNFFQDIGIEEQTRANEEKQIENLQKNFLDCFIGKIKQSETKKEIINLIYELRYYEQIPYKEENIRNIEKSFNREIENVEKMLIKKACEQKILTTFSPKEELNKRILENQFTSKIINLENTIYILKYHKGILKIQK